MLVEYSRSIAKGEQQCRKMMGFTVSRMLRIIYASTTALGMLARRAAGKARGVAREGAVSGQRTRGARRRYEIRGPGHPRYGDGAGRRAAHAMRGWRHRGSADRYREHRTGRHRPRHVPY